MDYPAVMRTLVQAVEDGLSLEPPDTQWREKMLAYARQEDGEFTALQPDETGLGLTVYASENAAYPTIIVDSKPGIHFYPSPGSKAFCIGEKTGDSMMDRWIDENLSALRAYCAGAIDTYEFNEQMRPMSRQLNEMANYDRGRFNTPLAFKGHTVGQARQSDVNGMISWLEAHRDVFIAYYTGDIATQQFETYLAAHPYP